MVSMLEHSPTVDYYFLDDALHIIWQHDTLIHPRYSAKYVIQSSQSEFAMDNQVNQIQNRKMIHK